MAYYVRKIARAKWQKEPLNNDKDIAELEIKSVSADAITVCTKTYQGKLSLWKVESANNIIEDIVPLILGFERPDDCDIIYIAEEDLLEEGITVEKSPGDANTPIEELKETHYNAVVKDYAGLGKFAKVVLKSLVRHKRFKKREVKDKLKSMLDNNEINKDMISGKLYDKVKDV